MYTLDASVIARSFDPADEASVVSQELIDLLEQRAVPVIVPRLLLAEVAGAELAADEALRGADAAYVAVALEQRCALVTLDREQRVRAARRVRTLTPAEALAELSAARS